MAPLAMQKQPTICMTENHIPAAVRSVVATQLDFLMYLPANTCSIDHLDLVAEPELLLTHSRQNTFQNALTDRIISLLASRLRALQ